MRRTHNANNIKAAAAAIESSIIDLCDDGVDVDSGSALSLLDDAV